MKTSAERSKAWRLANPERVKAWRLAHIEEEKSRNHEWYTAHVESKRAKNRAWHAANADRLNPNRRVTAREIKFRVMQKLGGKCVCCGEGAIEFLAVDHINGGGGKHRAEVGFGSKFYAWLLKQSDWSAFRLLCHNCNWAVSRGGVCPHQYGPRLVGESDAG